MPDQAQSWSNAAPSYEREYVDPYRDDVRNPLWKALQGLADVQSKTVADLGCGIGPLLPFLAERFCHVYAVDFAAGMLDRARERCKSYDNVKFLHRSLTDLTFLQGQVDVAVAINSLVMPDVRDLDAAVNQVQSILKPGGVFFGIVPAMDGVHYLTMLLVDRALQAGMPLPAARKNAAYHIEHECYDFAFGQYCHGALEQHFWQPFEVRYRLRRAGFVQVRLERVWLSWEQFACRQDFKGVNPPWDWFFEARKEEKREA